MGRMPLLALCLLATPMFPALASDTPVAQLPYSQLLEYQQRVDSFRDLKQLSVSEQVRSKLPAVKPSDIKFTIMRDAAHGGPLAVAVDRQGHFTLPVTKALQDEDPVVVSNQPKGSMQLSITYDVLPPTATSMPYHQLMLGIQQYNEAMRRQGFMVPMLAHQAAGLLLIYPSGGHQLTLHGTGQDRVIPGKNYKELGMTLDGFDASSMPVATTLIYVPLDSTLLKQDPLVTLDALPTQVFPAF